MSSTLLPAALVQDQHSVLHEIRNEDVNLAIWQHSLPFDLGPLVKRDVSDIRFVCDARSFPSRFKHELDQAAYPAGELRDWLVKDATNLVESYCGIMKAKSVEARLEVVTTNSCRKWHADYVSARLITTYAGRATQWLTGSDAERIREGLEPLSARSMQTGDVGLFKGKVATAHPAIHRSPPIAGTGERRLLFVLNPEQS